MMIRLALLLSLLASPAFAFGHVVPGWSEVTEDGYTYFMPPHSCTVGKLAKHVVLYKPQKWMDAYKAFPHRKGLAPNGSHWHTFAAILIDSYGTKIYISSDLPKIVQHDQLVHEEAHLRGCLHPWSD